MRVFTRNHVPRGMSASRMTTRFVAGAAIAGLFVAACSKKSTTAPSTTGPLATITLTPTPVTLPAGASQQFTAVGKDANGNVLVIAPTWSVVASGGTVNATGLFTAGATGGTFTNTVMAASGAITATATVTVNVVANLARTHGGFARVCRQLCDFGQVRHFERSDVRHHG